MGALVPSPMIFFSCVLRVQRAVGEMMEKIILEAIGATGFVMILVAFTLNAVGRMEHGGYSYGLLNAVGSIILAYYAYMNHVMVFVALEVVWAAVAIWVLAQRSRRPAEAGH